MEAFPEPLPMISSCSSIAIVTCRIPLSVATIPCAQLSVNQSSVCGAVVAKSESLGVSRESNRTAPIVVELLGLDEGPPESPENPPESGGGLLEAEIV